MIRILSFCTNPDILPVMDRLVNKHSDQWESHRAPDLATAKQVLTDLDIDIVLLGAGTGEEEQAILHQLTTQLGKATRYIKHYGGGSGLLYAEIEEALK